MPQEAPAGRDLQALEKCLGHRFARRDLLEHALTHSSTVRGQGDRNQSNERLEFLGDRVLGLVIAELLMDHFPHEEEGALAPRHTALVRREALARVARSIDLAPLIHMTRGEEEAGGRNNPALLADCCEAVIAALYLDGGLDAARRFIRSHWRPLMEAVEAPPKDNKTALQEWAQARGLALPSYTVVARDGPPHAPTFTVEVALPGIAPVRAVGTSKRTAEQAAAGELLTALEDRP